MRQLFTSLLLLIFTSGFLKAQQLEIRGRIIAQAHEAADSGRFLAETSEFRNKLDELAHTNNWDTGAQLVMEHSSIMQRDNMTSKMSLK